MTQDITTIQAIASNIFSGNNHDMIISINSGKTRNSFALWEYTLVNGWKLTYKFIKIVGIKAVEGEYCRLHRVLGLTADWHTQANLSRVIMNEVNVLKNEAIAETGEMPFGKYKGTKVSDLTDLQTKLVLAREELEASKAIHDCLTDDLIMMDHELTLVARGRYVGKYVKFVDETGFTYMCKVTDAVSGRGIINFHAEEVVLVDRMDKVSLCVTNPDGIAISATLSHFKSNGSIIKASEYHALANRCTESA